MPTASLIEKLVKAGAVEKEGGELTFTVQFAAHAILACGTNALMEMTVGNWYEVLQSFHPSLGRLSPDEVADVALLFDYYLSSPEVPTSAVR